MAEISVIVPVYKAEDFLRRCTDSILGQSFSDFELLLIDDGSPDGSGRLCDQIAAEDVRVRVIHKENGGVSSARNLGIEKARGRFLAFADADDWMEPEALELLYGTAMENAADSAGCAHYRTYPDGRTQVEEAALPTGVYGPEEIREGIVYRLLGDRLEKPGRVLNGFIWRFLFSREIVMKQNIRFLGAYLEDELFLMEYFLHAKCLAILSLPLYFYLQNPRSVTRSYLKDYMETYESFLEKKAWLVSRFGLEKARPLWRESSDWASLLIAVGNEYSRSNPASWGEKSRRVKALAQRPDMQAAMKAITPEGLGRNKQLVADLLRGGHFGILTALYAVKNRKG